MESIHCNGFKAAGVASGLKKKGGKDLGLIFSETPANAAGAFTRNLVKAAPVILDMERIASGVCQALIVNSGNANCCTGEKGFRDAETMAALAAEQVGVSPDLVLVASTGVIGQPLAVEKIAAAAPALADALRPDGFSDLAEAIMTTDTFPKTASAGGELGGKEFTIIGLAKGAGMIRPDMATMLCFVCTDAAAAPEVLKEVLAQAADRTFNRITVDGDTSTNDTVILLANGASGAQVNDGPGKRTFQNALDRVMDDLARMIVKDGEGATKCVEIRVTGAISDADARKAADAVANSNLVKTALFGQDANWGRIIAAVGRAGIPMDPRTVDIYFDTVMMVQHGEGLGDAAETAVSDVLKKPEFTITVSLNMGHGEAAVLTCDFSLDYVRINADYRS